MNNADNKVTLTGFAGSDAELKEVGSNKKLAKVSIAVHDNYKNAAGAEVQNTQWFNLVFWAAMAEEAANLIKKGTRFTAEGRLSTQQYEAKDGSKRYSTEVIVNEISILNPAVAADAAVEAG